MITVASTKAYRSTPGRPWRAGSRRARPASGCPGRPEPPGRSSDPAPRAPRQEVPLPAAAPVRMRGAAAPPCTLQHAAHAGCGGWVLPGPKHAQGFAGQSAPVAQHCLLLPRRLCEPGRLQHRARTTRGHRLAHLGKQHRAVVAARLEVEQTAATGGQGNPRVRAAASPSFRPRPVMGDAGGGTQRSNQGPSAGEALQTRHGGLRFAHNIQTETLKLNSSRHYEPLLRVYFL